MGCWGSLVQIQSPRYLFIKVNRLLEIKDIFVNYGKEEILKGISLNIQKDEKVILLGPNGSGKTTLVKTILGLLKIKNGSIKIFGKEIENIRGETRLATNYPPVYSLFSINLRDLFDLYIHLKAGDLEYAKTLLENLGLKNVWKKKLHQLSAGQQILVCNILAIASNPELLILDEPFENVDPARREKILNLILNYKGTVLLITHQLSVLGYFPNYSLYFIFEGKLYGPLQPLEKILETYIHLKDLENPLLVIEVGGKKIYLSDKLGDYKLKDFIDITRIYEILI
uniref:ATP-binding cassette domain-containing protein n=1 Tax=candidate division WOR-3 bacterium TaxID=2052148 RepID=A0A7V4CH20_UNCW3